MDITKDVEQKLKPLIDGLKQEFLNIRTNRPTTKLVEDIKVDYLGQQLTIRQMGSITIAPPREIDISVWDKEALGAVIKAIETSGRGLTANTQGNLIRINLPSLTDERRQEIIKLVKSIAEQTKMKIRASRDDANKKVEADFKSKIISEDQKFKSKDQIQKAVDKANLDLENLLVGKIQEING
jgi:ribosome recycling factor